MDIFEHLTQEHDVARQVMAQLKDKPQKGMWGQLQTALTGHLAGEEDVVYPALDRFPELHMNVLESIEEHRVIKRLMGEIDKLDPGDEEWRAKFKVMKEAVEHHAGEEEQTIFPKARRFVDAQMSDRIDADFSQAEKKAA